MADDTHKYYSQPVEEILQQLEVQADQGLSNGEAAKRIQEFGPNKLREAKGRSVTELLLSQFKSVVIWVLVAAGVAAFAFGEWIEGIAIVAVIFINTAIGFVSEWKAVRSMEALRSSEQIKVRVRRDGQDHSVPMDDLVPGDIVNLEAGDVVPADVRIIESNGLGVKEAALTGESVPVHKSVEPVDPAAPLAERSSMAYRSTVITEGSGEAVVVATAMKTEIGRISELTEAAESERTPLERQLNRLGRRLAYITMAVAVVVAIAGVVAGRETAMMIETAIALGVAAIPEGLPIVATIALARGMYLMAQRNAIVNVLTAVETLGATRVIFTDKTGTLTENSMRVRKIASPAGEVELDGAGQQAGQNADTGENGNNRGGELQPGMRRILEVGVLCNNAAVTAADPDEEESHGDPTEVALLAAALVHGIDRSALLEERPEAREEPFNSDTMMMATFHEIDGAFEVAVKGAPKYVLDACTAIVGEDGSDSRPLEDKERQEWLERTTSLAGEGLRLLAIADKRVDNTEAEPYTDLRFLGLVGLFDPPREDVREAIAECKGAGIRVVMVTGDQPETARAIALDVGLVTAEDATVVHGGDLKDPKDLSDEDRNEILNTAIFARVSPEQKLNLIKVYQDAQYTVAMTGDGVNDAPALKKADIGVAMGIRGTPAAREVADMVLKDDALSSIAAAVEQGRIIFSNIRKSVLFMLCTNVAEIVAVTVASLATIPIPLLPLHILYLNVLTDVFPALALGMGKGSSDVMKNPPRPQGEAVLTKRHWRAIAGWALLVGACVLAALLLALYWLDLDERSAVTVSFMTLGFTKLWFVFNLRDRGSSFLHNDIVNNPYIWGAMAFCMALLLAAVYMPGLSGILQTRALGWHAWALVLAASLVPFLVGQVIRAFQQAPANEAKAGEA